MQRRSSDGRYTAKTVQSRIAETLARKGGKIKGQPATEENTAAYLRATAERKVKESRVKKPDLTGKPRSWKQVCDTERTVKIPQYTRTGTMDGKLMVRQANGLGGVPIAGHCRNPGRK